MLAKLKAFWKSLPHQIQATVTTAAGSFIVTAAHAWSEGGCVNLPCLKHYAATAFGSAAGILYAFYMKPAQSDSAKASVTPINSGKI